MSEGDIILPMSRIPSVGEFLQILGIKPGGFAAQLLESVYDELFVSSTDLRSEYDRYYCVEYPAFSSYLGMAHGIEVKPRDLEKKYVLLVRSLGGVMDEIYDDNVKTVVLDCVRTLEGDHED